MENFILRNFFKINNYKYLEIIFYGKGYRKIFLLITYMLIGIEGVAVPEPV
jgi:hypothetical protein